MEAARWLEAKLLETRLEAFRAGRRSGPKCEAQAGTGDAVTPERRGGRETGRRWGEQAQVDEGTFFVFGFHGSGAVRFCAVRFLRFPFCGFRFGSTAFLRS